MPWPQVEPDVVVIWRTLAADDAASSKPAADERGDHQKF
jgi:hypothetical protein